MTLIMKAKEAAAEVYETIKLRVEDLKKRDVHPRLATILIEGDPASAYYAQAKQKIANKLGVAFQLHSFKRDVTEEEILQLITELNANPDVHGIMLELPLPQHLSAAIIEKAISPAKDIDGVTPSNKLATVTGSVGLYPATPQACIKLLKHYGYELEAKNVTLIGRGQTVGLPLFHMLQRENATVTVCHSRTPDLAPHLQQADISFVAVGRPNVVDPTMVHPGLVLIDAGINETDAGQIVGDVAADVSDHVAALSPVPGGVGTLTTAILFENLLKAIDLQQSSKALELGSIDQDLQQCLIDQNQQQHSREEILEMSSITWDQSIRSFIQQAGSADPTPGGGSVAALVAALGAAMTSMVGNLSQGEKFASIQPQITDILAKMEELSATCAELLSADIASFEQYMAALRLPKNTDEEKEIRKQALQQATVAAIDVPLRLIMVCREGMQYTYSIAESSNKNVISDLGIGAILFEAAAQSALLTVDINLAGLKDLELKRQYEEQSKALLHEIIELKTKTLLTVSNRISG